jgi:hypothetical protein
MGDLLVNWPPQPPILLIYHSNRAPTSAHRLSLLGFAANARWLSAKMHHAGEGMVGERALAQHLAARGRNLVVVLHRAAADADCSEQYAVLDDRQSAGKGDEAAIRNLNAVQRLPRLRQFAKLAGPMVKKQAVFAFLMAISIEPTQASSMRMKARKFAPESTTAMHILVSRWIASLRAAAMAFSACSRSICMD